MTGQSFVPLPGSERGALPDSQQLGAVDEAQQIEVTLVTRRRAALPRDLVEGPATLTREQFAEQHGTDPADLDLISTVLAGHGLRVTSADAGARRVTVTGTIAALSATFGATLRLARTPDPVTGRDMVEHRYREGGLQIPAELNGIVLAVLGLDDRPQARAQFRRAPAAGARTTAPGSTAPAPGGPPPAVAPAVAPTSYTPPQVAGLYQFPAGTDGTGQTIAIIELGGGFGSSDLDAYFAGLGLPVPSITAASVDGAVNQPGQDPNGADGEVLLDIEVAGGVAPGATQVVYFAPNTDQGFVDAVTTAVHATPTPAVVSISWGQSEDSWTEQARTSLDQAMADAAALGVTVTVAAGDNGSSDGQSGSGTHVDFPASSPHALACGGTSLRGNATTGVISSETVWNDGASGGATGGGVSDTFGLPSWQASAGVPAPAGGAPAGGAADTAAGRGVPDVAGCADPATGYQVRVDGQSTVIGGTSAVAPLWAGLISRLAQSTGKPFGLIQPLLYAGVTAGTAAPGFRDITSGSNGVYTAGPGWDACTGLGSPEASSLLTSLGGTQAEGDGAQAGGGQAGEGQAGGSGA